MTKFQKLLKEVDYIVQPLINEVANGERSYLFFDAVYSHTVLKKPQHGDYRVQEAYGDTVETIYPTIEEIAVASTFVQKFANNSLYARVDGIMVNGTFLLIELELIEPFLFLSYSQNALEKYYQAILKHMAFAG